MKIIKNSVGSKYFEREFVLPISKVNEIKINDSDLKYSISFSKNGTAIKEDTINYIKELLHDMEIHNSNIFSGEKEESLTYSIFDSGRNLYLKGYPEIIGQDNINSEWVEFNRRLVLKTYHQAKRLLHCFKNVNIEIETFTKEKIQNYEYIVEKVLLFDATDVQSWGEIDEDSLKNAIDRLNKTLDNTMVFIECKKDTEYASLENITHSIESIEYDNLKLYGKIKRLNTKAFSDYYKPISKEKILFFPKLKQRTIKEKTIIEDILGFYFIEKLK